MEEPTVAQSSPIAVELEAGKRYFWCACGRSQKQPFCDGSHKGTVFKPIKFTAEVSETRFLCCCKASGQAPFCDGTHKTL